METELVGAAVVVQDGHQLALQRGCAVAGRCSKCEERHGQGSAPVSPMLPRSFIIRWNSLEGMLTCREGGKRGWGGAGEVSAAGRH